MRVTDRFAKYRAAIEFRRTAGEMVWHWCRNCSRWPTHEVELLDVMPKPSETCSECQERTEARTCEG